MKRQSKEHGQDSSREKARDGEEVGWAIGGAEKRAETGFSEIAGIAGKLSIDGGLTATMIHALNLRPNVQATCAAN